jgi:GR25 family glycosyltransferase involved in LPS biosynthesis
MKFIFTKDNSFCINLERRVDRWENMQKMFEKASIDVTRYNACTPDNVTDPIPDTFFPTQRACAQSHINVWKLLVERNLPYAIIFEDDVTLDKTWREKLTTLPTDDFDLVMLNASSVHVFPVNEWFHPYYTFLTGCYIVSQRCAKHLLDSGEFGPSDHMLVNHQAHYRQRCYSYLPYLAIQTSRDSDIQGSIPDESYVRVIKNLVRFKYPLSNYF